MFNKRSLLGAGSSIGFALLLAGCGGGDDGPASDPGRGQSGSGAFINTVNEVVNNDSDTAEPIEVDAINETTSDTADPVPVS